MSDQTLFLLEKAIIVLAVFGGVMLVVALTTLVERRVAGFIQDRYGPNRVGPFGILQPAADGLKNFLKEETMPAAAAQPYFWLGPVISLAPALVTFAVVPFAAPLPIAGTMTFRLLASVGDSYSVSNGVFSGTSLYGVTFRANFGGQFDCATRTLDGTLSGSYALGGTHAFSGDATGTYDTAKTSFTGSWTVAEEADSAYGGSGIWNASRTGP